jgi:hypothetical protein
VLDENEVAEEELTDLEAHLDAYAERIHRQHEERLQQFQAGINNLVNRHTRERQVTEAPTFYLDSNGEPCVIYEPTSDPRASQNSHSCLGIKAPPYCRLNSNGELESVIAPNRTSNGHRQQESEIPVIVDTRRSQDDKIIKFKEVKEAWRDSIGECVGR